MPGISGPVTMTVRGGQPAVLRPLAPADREIYLACLEHVGPESRRRRFLGPKHVLSEHEIRYFTEVDHHEHEALVAVIGGSVVAVARFVRDRQDRGLADWAIVVVDEWQGHGVGTALLRRLTERASEEGIERLHGTMLHDNTGMFATIRRLGLPWRTVSSSSGIAEVELRPAPRAAVPPAVRGPLGLVA
ncbi:MAG: GNAT family N-acetyltransferase [Chloroflexi bacterium]|nr:MAG: GNAT family N-acetyltransferase [Chloroflexota bacterium]